MERIKTIVDNLDIPKKREELEQAKKEILIIKGKMSDLTIHQKVAEYVFTLNSLKVMEGLSPEDRFAARTKIEEARNTIYKLANDDNVREYMRLLYRAQELESIFSNYHKTINSDLRIELLDQELPNFYVYQGFLTPDRKYKLCRHLIAPYTIVTYDDPSEIDTLIKGDRRNLSNRNARKLYNQVSYRYLEQLSKDYSFDLEKKDLGNVSILRRGH